MKARVLFLAANPKDQTQLDLEREAEEIAKKIQASEFGDEIEIIPHWSTGPDDVIQLFNEDDDWQIVHYSGHGSKEHEILLIAEDGRTAPVTKEALTRLFGVFGRKAKVAVFNACYAVGQAEAVIEKIDSAIGMSRAVSDEGAILFAASFYRAIGFGKSVKQAFDQGCLAIQMHAIPEADTPQLRSRDGLDPDNIHLLQGTAVSVPSDEWTRFAPPPPSLVLGQKWHVFLSYRSVNRPWVLNLYDVLQRHGYRLFLDQYAIQPGTSLISRLNEGLSKSRAGVLIWSTQSSDSAWCMSEYETMQARSNSDPDFRFVALCLERDIELPAIVHKDVWIDFSEYPDGPNGGSLLRLLFALAEKEMTPKAVQFATDQDEETRQAQSRIKAAVQIGNAGRLVDLFRKGGRPWSSTAMLGAQTAEGLAKLGKYSDALSVLDEVQKRFPRSVRPKQMRALALRRRGGEGDILEAQEILAMLCADGHDDPETLGIFAATWMKRYEAEENLLFLRRSRDLYAQAFEHAPDDTYTGINAAAKSVLLDEIEKGRHYAKRVYDYLTENTPWDYWTQATLAEAELILEDTAMAAEDYGKAVTMSPNETGSHRSTWEQAKRLREKLDIGEEAWASIRDVFGHVR